MTEKTSLIDVLRTTDEFYPFDKNGNLNFETLIDFLMKRGFLFDINSEKWYRLDETDNLYYECKNGDFTVSTDIVQLIHFYDKSYPVSRQFQNTLLDNYSKIRNNLSLFGEFLEICDERDNDKCLLDGSYKDLYYADSKSEFKLIQCKNGVLNPLNGVFSKNDKLVFYPDIYNVNFIYLSEFELNNDYRIVRDEYLKLFPDEKTLNYFLYWLGSCIFDVHPLDNFLLIYGPGGTGKTTLTNVLNKLFPSSCVSNQTIDQIANEFGTFGLVGKHLAILNETETLDKTAYKGITATLKRIVGSETIHVVPKYHNGYDAILTCRLLLTGNCLPEIDMTDSGSDRRPRVIPFNNVHVPDFEILYSDDGLNWLFNASLWAWRHHSTTLYDDPSAKLNELRYFRHKDQELMSDVMIRETNYFINTSSFNAWLEEYCGSRDIKTVQSFIDGKFVNEIHGNYVDYCTYMQTKSYGIPKFNAHLRREFHIERISSRNGGYYKVRN